MKKAIVFSREARIESNAKEREVPHQASRTGVKNPSLTSLEIANTMNSS